MPTAKVLLLLITCSMPWSSVYCDCGQPPLPEGISHDQYQLTYTEGNEIVLTCSYPYEPVTWDTPKGYFLPYYASKTVKIICSSGEWIGRVPRCAKPLPLVNSEKVVKQIDFVSGEVSSTQMEMNEIPASQNQLVIDNFLVGWNSRYHKNLSSCIYDISSFIRTSHTWVLRLRKQESIAFITLEIKEKLSNQLLDYTNPPIKAYVNKHRSCRLHYIANTVGALAQILCELSSVDDINTDEDSRKTDKIIIYFNNQISAEVTNVISLCLYSFPKSCGLPEIPLNGRGYLDDMDFHFSCTSKRHEYKPGSVDRIKCLPDAQWSGQLDKCEPIVTCPLISNYEFRSDNVFTVNNLTEEKYEYEHFEYHRGFLVAVPSTVELHRCSSEKVVGIRVCDKDGRWLGISSECHNGTEVPHALHATVKGWSHLHTIVTLGILLLTSIFLIILLAICVIVRRGPV